MLHPETGVKGDQEVEEMFLQRYKEEKTQSLSHPTDITTVNMVHILFEFSLGTEFL